MIGTRVLWRPCQAAIRRYQLGSSLLISRSPAPVACTFFDRRFFASGVGGLNGINTDWPGRQRYTNIQDAGTLEIFGAEIPSTGMLEA